MMRYDCYNIATILTISDNMLHIATYSRYCYICHIHVSACFNGFANLCSCKSSPAMSWWEDFFASNSRAKPSRVLSVAETWLRKRRDFFAFSLTSLSLQCKQLKTAQKNTEAEDKAMPVFVEFLLCMFQQLRITMIKRSE